MDKEDILSPEMKSKLASLPKNKLVKILVTAKRPEGLEDLPTSEKRKKSVEYGIKVIEPIVDYIKSKGGTFSKLNYLGRVVGNLKPCDISELARQPYVAEICLEPDKKFKVDLL